MNTKYILMGDVIGSRQFPQEELRANFVTLIDSCNRMYKEQIESPYTVTLGDEFQGIPNSLSTAVSTIFYLEETLFSKQFPFSIRYVLVFGTIQTPINTEIAYTMMGPGLTKARELLSDKKRGEPRFHFDLSNLKTSDYLNTLFFVLDGIARRWRKKDSKLILEMIQNSNDKEVARKHNKNRSQIWKRRKNNLIDEYRSLKEIILRIAQEEKRGDSI